VVGFTVVARGSFCLPEQGLSSPREKEDLVLSELSSDHAPLSPTSPLEKVLHKFVDTTTKVLLPHRTSPCVFPPYHPNITNRERGGDDWKEASVTISASGSGELVGIIINVNSIMYQTAVKEHQYRLSCS
jgi:hypothetical protein